MLPSKLFPLACAAALLGSAFTAWSQANTEYTITKIEPAFQTSPTFQGVAYDKRGSRPQNWLEVEVTFAWAPRQKEPKYTEELTFNYYILLKATSPQAPKGILLTGSVTHVNIPQGKDLHSVVYVSPRTLERFFDGKVPANANAALTDVGVTISKQGQLVAEASWKGRGSWWSQFQTTPGYVLNKSETPFAPLAWDYYEAIKSKAPGF